MGIAGQFRRSLYYQLRHMPVVVRHRPPRAAALVARLPSLCSEGQLSATAKRAARSAAPGRALVYRPTDLTTPVTGRSENARRAADLDGRRAISEHLSSG